MSKQIEDNPSRISFAPGKVSAAKLDAVAEDLGYESRANLIRDTLADLVAEHSEADPDATLSQPDNEELQAAYERLLELSKHPMGTRTLSVDEARDQLYTRECPKTAVKDRLLRPLAYQGFISVKGGKIRVHRRTEQQVAQAEQEAEKRLERLEIGGPSLPSESDRTQEQKSIRKYQRADLNVPFDLGAWVAERVVWSPTEATA